MMNPSSLPSSSITHPEAPLYGSLHSTASTVSAEPIGYNASELIHLVLKEAFFAAKLDNYTDAISDFEKPAAWETWGVGLAIISLCSYTAPLGFLLLPLLGKSLYDRAMTFLISLGIGALSGSTMFIMVPSAFHITDLDNFDYHTKSAIVVAALYGFFSVDRILQYVLELRRRRIARRKVHQSTIASILHSPKPAKRTPTRFTTEETYVETDSERQSMDETKDRKKANGELSREQTSERKLEEGTIEKEKHQLAEELDFALTANSLARTFSTRRRVAVINAVDEIEFRDHENVENSNQDNAGEFLDAVNGDFRRNQSIRRSVKPEEPSVAYHKNGRRCSKDEVAVDIRVVEKKVIEPGTIEVASVAYMIIFGSSANNFVDGMSMGAAFSDSLLRGLSIGIAVISQQLPQEMGVLAILVNSGLGMKKTLLYNFIPIMLSYAGFVAGVFLDNMDETYDQYIFAISSGMYMYIFLGTLIPEIRESTNELIKTDLRESLVVTALQYLGFASGVIFMFSMSLREDNSSDF